MKYFKVKKSFGGGSLWEFSHMVSDSIVKTSSNGVECVCESVNLVYYENTF